MRGHLLITGTSLSDLIDLSILLTPYYLTTTLAPSPDPVSRAASVDAVYDLRVVVVTPATPRTAGAAGPKSRIVYVAAGLDAPQRCRLRESGCPVLDMDDPSPALLAGILIAAGSSPRSTRSQ
jgi:hypothetical protein